MKLFFIFLSALLIKFNAPVRHLQGTYAYSPANKKIDYAPSGFLKIHYINNKNILFYLEVSRATDFNSGALYGRLIPNKKNGHYEYIPKDLANGCALEFIRKGNSVIIKTVTGDCQFGYGVDADGKYYLKDNRNPSFLVNRKGLKIYFDKEPPENYLE